MPALTDEQKLIQDSVARFVRDKYDFTKRQEILGGEKPFLAEHWRQFAELGWIAAAFKEEDGGLGGSLGDIAVIQEQLGQGLYVGPYVSSVLLAGQLVAALGTTEQKKQILPNLIEGKSLLSFAYAEAASRYNLSDVSTTAKFDSDSNTYLVNGAKSVVLYGEESDTIIVSVRTSGAQRDRNGISLLFVPSSSQGVTYQSYRNVDGSSAAEILFDDVSVSRNSLLGKENSAITVIEDVSDFATLALAAEAIGCMKALYEQTLDYIKQREQFGAPLSSFQALQHRMVDVFMSYELSQSMTQAAIDRFSEQDQIERRRLVSAAKTQIGQGGRHIGQEAIQLHGGMGMTNDLPIGHYFKRLTMINTLFGDATYHLKRFQQLGSPLV